MPKKLGPPLPRAYPWRPLSVASTCSPGPGLEDTAPRPEMQLSEWAPCSANTGLAGAAQGCWAQLAGPSLPNANTRGLGAAVTGTWWLGRLTLGFSGWKPPLFTGRMGGVPRREKAHLPPVPPSASVLSSRALSTADMPPASGSGTETAAPAWRLNTHAKHTNRKQGPPLLWHLWLLLTRDLYDGASWSLQAPGANFGASRLVKGIKHLALGAPWTLTCCGKGWAGEHRSGMD